MNSEYILMCKGASEIQEMWLKGMGNPYSNVIHKMNSNNMAKDMNFAVVNYTPEMHKTDGLKDYIWLPRQEDLQNILSEAHGTTSWGIEEGFNFYFNENMDFAGKNENAYVKKNDPLVQIWLCYIMETLFKKRWNVETKKWTVIM